MCKSTQETLIKTKQKLLWHLQSSHPIFRRLLLNGFLKLLYTSSIPTLSLFPYILLAPSTHTLSSFLNEFSQKSIENCHDLFTSLCISLYTHLHTPSDTFSHWLREGLGSLKRAKTEGQQPEFSFSSRHFKSYEVSLLEFLGMVIIKERKVGESEGVQEVIKGMDFSEWAEGMGRRVFLVGEVVGKWMGKREERFKKIVEAVIGNEGYRGVIEIEEEFLEGIQKSEEIDFERIYNDAKSFLKNRNNFKVIEELEDDEEDKFNEQGTPEMPTQTPSDEKLKKIDKKSKKKIEKKTDKETERVFKIKKENKKSNKRTIKTRSIKPKKELKSPTTSKPKRKMSKAQNSRKSRKNKK